MTEGGARVSAAGVGEGTRVKVADRLGEYARLAVTVTAASCGVGEVAMGKVARCWPSATVTLAGVEAR